jgi:hypothetical protein
MPKPTLPPDQWGAGLPVPGTVPPPSRRFQFWFRLGCLAGIAYMLTGGWFMAPLPVPAFLPIPGANVVWVVVLFALLFVFRSRSYRRGPDA